jgi:hypothetical protein
VMAGVELRHCAHLSGLCHAPGLACWLVRTS